MSTVNKDYIGIIRNVNGCVRFVKEEIQQKTALVEDLKAMLENPNRTIFDLQSRMDMEFLPSERISINYLAPYSYSSSYVSGVSYPKAPTYDEYETELEKKREEYTQEYENRFADLKTENLQDYNTKIKENVENDMANLNKDKKNDFYSLCTRFCQAYSYVSLLHELKSDPDVKMWSTDTVGWTNLSYDITDDIRIDIHTNFGYGWSSYFYLGLTYKGIDILPYTLFVNYYYADSRDIARYTRLYATDRNSWDYAFNFVETVAAKAAEGDDSFAKEYVMNEVQEMISRLRAILDNPTAYFNTFLKKKNNQNESHYLTVHDMTEQEKNTYKVYPDEMIDVFQAEKIAGALEFVEKISALEPIYNQAIKAADEIKGLSLRIIPQIEKNIARIAVDVERLQAKEDKLIRQVEAIEREIEPHTAKIDANYEEKCSKAKENEHIWKYKVEEEYSEKHPEYANLISKRNEISSELSTVRNEKSDRLAFQSRLEQCRAEIEDVKAE